MSNSGSWSGWYQVGVDASGNVPNVLGARDTNWCTPHDPYYRDLRVWCGPVDRPRPGWSSREDAAMCLAFLDAGYARDGMAAPPMIIVDADTMAAIYATWQAQAALAG